MWITWQRKIADGIQGLVPSGRLCSIKLGFLRSEMLSIRSLWGGLMVTMPQNSLINHALSLTDKVRAQSEPENRLFYLQTVQRTVCGNENRWAECKGWRAYKTLELQALGFTGNWSPQERHRLITSKVHCISAFMLSNEETGNSSD